VTRRKIAGVLVAGGLVLGSPVLGGCAWSSVPMDAAAGYVTLTQDTFASAVATAASAKPAVREVITVDSGTSTYEFDRTTSVTKWRLAGALGSSTNGTPITGELMVIGDDLYLRASGMTPPGKWVKTTAAAAGLASAGTVGIDPSTLGEGLLRGMVSFKALGRTTIEGDDVQHYEVTVNTAAIVGQSKTNLGSGETVPESFYLNDDNTPRRIVITMPGGVGNTQIDFTHWGQGGTIEPPAPADVIIPKPQK